MRPGRLDPVVPEVLRVPRALEVPEILSDRSGLVVPGDLDFHLHRRKVRAGPPVPEVLFARLVPVLPGDLVCRQVPVIPEVRKALAVPAGQPVPEVREDLQAPADRWCPVLESSAAGRGSH